MRTLIAFIVGVLLGLIPGVGPAHAHGAAAWIAANPETQFCCGVRDCRSMPDGAVTHLNQGGYLINGQHFPEIGGMREGDAFSHVFASKDSHYWACFSTWIETEPGGYAGRVADVETEWQGLQVRCLFVPAIGF